MIKWSATCLALLIGSMAMAQDQEIVPGQRVISGGQKYINIFDSEFSELKAAIWVDPDGCEHWVIDDGVEGYMSSHLDRSGKPVCRGTPGVCKTFDGAALFRSGSARVSGAARRELRTYFKSIAGQTVFVDGHTDSQGDARANLALSVRRAEAVAKLALASGVNAIPRGFGEQMPVADNETADGRKRNRRVELSCRLANGK